MDTSVRDGADSVTARDALLQQRADRWPLVANVLPGNRSDLVAEQSARLGREVWPAAGPSSLPVSVDQKCAPTAIKSDGMTSVPPR